MPQTEDRTSLSEATAAFRKTFDGLEPTFLARAPGRVNLIGEHTDYNDLPVLPMALQREIQILFTPRTDSVVRVANGDSEFGKHEFTITTLISPEVTGHWGNYLRAPCQGLARWFCGISNQGHAGALGADEQLRGIDALITSTLPVASGLSSSSALVIAMGRALLQANNLEMETLEFAEAMARAERFTGTQGGGMDQAISAGGMEGHASRIEFNPLRMFETPVPEHWRFIVAHTLVRAEKSGRAQEAYNNRTRECRAALETVGQALLKAKLLEMGSSLQSTITYPNILANLCIDDLVTQGEMHLEGDLQKRFRHVVTEGNRVYDAEEALKRSDLDTFGLLMNASHESLRDDYQVSSKELDTLVELALGAGAAGARLTGAGFGGCAVILTDEANLEGVFGALTHGYYDGNPALTTPLEDVLFVAQASAGASATKL
jgi:galactokinase